MPSASTTGSPVSAATMSGIIELMPPHSIGIVASAGRPRCSSRMRSDRVGSVPAGIFSTMTVGAPICAVGMTKRSSAISSGSRMVMRPLAENALDEHHPDVRVPSPAGAEKGCATGQVAQVVPS